MKILFGMAMTLVLGYAACQSAPDLYVQETKSADEESDGGNLSDDSLPISFGEPPAENQMLLIEDSGKKLSYQDELDHINAQLERFDIICETREVCLYKAGMYTGKKGARYFQGTEQDRNTLVNLLRAKARLLLTSPEIYKQTYNNT